MKLFLVTVGVTTAAAAYAGGVVGGNPGLAYVDNNYGGGSTGRLIDSLPKSYVAPDVYRRTLMRLSPQGVDTVPMMIRGQYVDVVKVEDRIVDSIITSEILPD